MIHWTLIAAIGLLFSLFVVSRLLFAILQRVGTGFTIIEVVARALTLFALVGAYAVTISTEPGQLAASVIGSPLAAVAVNTLVTSVLAIAGIIIIARGLGSLLDSHRPTYTVPDRFRRRRRRTIFALAVAVTLVAEAVRIGVAGVSGAWVVVTVVVAWTIYLIRTTHFWVSPFGESLVRDPTEEERERIETCYERFGRSPGRIVVATDDAAIDVNALGRGAYHSVGVTEQFLECVDDTTLAVALAQADERSANGYWTVLNGMNMIKNLFFSLILFTWPAFLLGLFMTSSRLFWFVLPLLVFLPVPLLAWLGRQSVYEADTFVESQFDTSTVASVYRELGEDIRYFRIPGGLFETVIGLDPTIEQRLEQLGIKTPDDMAEPDE